MKDLKNTARPLDRDYVNRRELYLSKKVLRVSVGQRAAKLMAIKVGGSQKISAAWPSTGE